MKRSYGVGHLSHCTNSTLDIFTDSAHPNLVDLHLIAKCKLLDQRDPWAFWRGMLE